MPNKNNNKKGGTFRNVNGNKYLTENQAKFVYEMVNAGKEINTETLQHEMKQKKVEFDMENTYQKAILSDVSKKNPTQMEEWSILNNHVKYIKHDGSEMCHNLNIDTLNYCQNKYLYKELKEKEILKASVNFGKSLEKLRSDYIYVYEGVYAEVISADRFDEDKDLSTT